MKSVQFALSLIALALAACEQLPRRIVVDEKTMVFALVQPPPWKDTKGINQALATLSRGESVALVNIEFHKDWAVYKVRLDDGRIGFVFSGTRFRLQEGNEPVAPTDVHR